MKRIMIVLGLMLMMVSSVMASSGGEGQLGIAVCMPGYALPDCQKSDCFGWHDTVYKSESECKMNMKKLEGLKDPNQQEQYLEQEREKQILDTPDIDEQFEKRKVVRNNLTFYLSEDVSTVLQGQMTVAMERFQERNKYQYDRIDVVPVSDEKSVVQIERQKKFLFWTVTLKDKYIIDNEGEIKEQKRSFWSYFYGRSKV